MDNMGVSYLKRYVIPSVISRLNAALHLQPRSLCLVTGPPCSGTTALGDWLGLQKGVVGISESRILIATHFLLEQIRRFNSLRNEDALLPTTRGFVYHYYARRAFLWRKLLLDKEPLEPIALPDENYAQFINNMRWLFPGLKLLFIIRHPLPTIWCMRNRQWGYSLAAGEPRMFTLPECVRIWKANASLIAQNDACTDIFICKFEDLVANPANMSVQILDFLEITRGTTFVPRQTRDVQFQEDVVAYVLHETAEERQLLNYGVDTL